MHQPETNLKCGEYGGAMAPKFLAWFTSFTWRSPKCSFWRSFSRMSSTYFGNCMPSWGCRIPTIVCFLRYFWMLDFFIISTYKWNETFLTNQYIRKPKTLSFSCSLNLVSLPPLIGEEGQKSPFPSLQKHY